MQYLDKIQSPQDLKSMKLAELRVLAQEIREELVHVVSKNGGHLAPNLGVVELTLALHFVYDAPQDKFIWDVGHQSYVHKMLTGRYNRIHTIRTQNGLSGFPKRDESEYDVFDTGHSSTSISAAAGMALARDLSGDDYRVIAVIGDGAMTGGMAFEALNYAGNMKSNLTVILNDNEMSIDPNVGAMSEYLSKIRTNPSYTKGKAEMHELLQKIPAIGDKMYQAADFVKDSLKYALVPGTLFEEFGFHYYGPVNGHDLAALTTVLENAKSISGPVLIHVITKKGKGYLPAEENPDLFHGTGPFDVKTGQVNKKPQHPTYTNVFGKTMVQLGKENEKIVGITAAMGKGTGISIFQEAFPNRTVDVGIAEQHAVTMAAAMATIGYKPVVAIYSTFLQRAYDQVLHDVALQNLPVVFALDRAGIVGDDGPTHHGVFDISYLRHIPNMTVMAPKDENELRHMLYSALQYNSPTALRYPRGEGLGVEFDSTLHLIPPGEGEYLQQGEKVTFLAYGSMVDFARQAAALLEEEKGIHATVINMRFVKPIDAQKLMAAYHAGDLMVTMEEQVLEGGFGSAVLEFFNEEQITDANVLRVGLADAFIPHGKTDLLREQCGLGVRETVNRIIGRLARN